MLFFPVHSSCWVKIKQIRIQAQILSTSLSFFIICQLKQDTISQFQMCQMSLAQKEEEPGLLRVW